MKVFPVLAASTVLMASAWLPALARDSFVKDDAALFTPQTVSALNTKISSFNAQTGKEIVVATVPSLQGATIKDAGERAYAQQQVNGVLIFIAKNDRKDIVIPDAAGVRAGWFTLDTTHSIRQAMEAQFRDGDFDRGITTGVGLVLNVYRQHLGTLRGAAGAPVRAYGRSPVSAPAQTGGFHMSFFWWIVIIVAGFLILRSLMRAMSAPRMTPPAPGPGAPGGAGYGGYGPGGGYGGGGGGGFFSGLLGGLGGAFLGNELFGNRGGGVGGGVDQGGSYGAPDAGNVADPGWASDAGQADTGAASSGDWGGGGFDSGGGGDMGGGGDSGGGW